LIEELERLRARASQQEESLARLADALSALRSDREELRAENRELRQALGEERRLRSRARVVRFA
jgi:chromosome segregation ATPase